MATEMSDFMMGTSDDDVLDGLGGGDFMMGGPGNDVYVVESSGDFVIENAGEGIDTVYSSITYVLPPDVERLVLTGTDNIDGYGNELGNDLFGNAGNNALFGFESNDRLDGGAGNDQLDADGGDDTLYGGAGDDVLDAGEGLNLLDGGSGNDSLMGGGGEDRYVFGLGYGQDVIADAGGIDALVLAGGLTLGDVTFERSGNDLMMFVTGITDRLTLTGWFVPASQVDSIAFGDGTVLDAAAIGALAGNTAPVAADDAVALGEDAAGPATGNVLANDGDPNAGDVLGVANPGTYAGAHGTLTLAADGTYSYTPDGSVQGLADGETVTDSFAYMVRDDAATPLEAGAQLTFTITGANDAPLMGTQMADQSAQAGEAFSFSLPAGAFTDIDGGDSLTLGANLADGSALPDWLAFDAATGRFSGTAPGADSGTSRGGAGGTTLSILVTAMDLAGAQTSDVFALAVTPAPDETPEEGRTIIGTRRDDHLVGTRGDDRIYGRRGADVMTGGQGDDTYLVDQRHDRVVERPNEGHDAVYSKASFTLPANVEDLHLLGHHALNGTGNGEANWLEGNSGRNSLRGRGGDDLLQGHGGRDWLRGGRGVDVLQGGKGDDTLRDHSGNTVFDGGRGHDHMSGGRDDDFFAGGRGSDALVLGGGADVVAFNKGDGVDRLYGGHQNGVLSLGGGIRYEDLRFRKEGSDLVLKTGGHDRIVLEDWYCGKQSVVTLQVVAEAMAGFCQSSGDPLRDDKIELFDFRALVQAFDDARACERNLRSWKLMGELLEAHLGGSDRAAVGGDLAYHYGMTGSLAGMGWGAARDTVAAPGFGAEMQALRPVAEVPAGPIKLG